MLLGVYRACVGVRISFTYTFFFFLHALGTVCCVSLRLVCTLGARSCVADANIYHAKVGAATLLVWVLAVPSPLGQRSAGRDTIGQLCSLVLSVIRSAEGRRIHTARVGTKMSCKRRRVSLVQVQQQQQEDYMSRLLR